MRGLINTASIIFVPYNNAIHVTKLDNSGSSSRIKNLEYAFEIPADISGCSLVEFITSTEFIEITNLIYNNWYSRWEGHTRVGYLNNYARYKLTDFLMKIKDMEFDLAFVGYAETYFGDEIEAFDSIGYPLSLCNIDKASTIIIAEKYIITPTSNTDLIINEIKSNFVDDIVINLERYIYEYHRIVCNNLRPNFESNATQH